ncbi:MAG: hypothetical protein WBE33_16575 [Planococcus citreus]
MNKKILIVVLTLMVFVALVGGTLIFLKSNPPLEINMQATNENQHFAVVGFGNKGWGDIHVTDVAVNDYEDPQDSKIQVSNEVQGLVHTDDFQSEAAQPYRFLNFDEVTIQTGTSPPHDAESASKDEEIYGLNVIHNEEIRTIHIQYSYFGITLFEEVEISF